MFWNRRLGRLEFRLERNWSDMFFWGDGVGGEVVEKFQSQHQPQTHLDSLQEAGPHSEVRSLGPRLTSCHPITIG